jgi:site-specific recombinase XerD
MRHLLSTLFYLRKNKEDRNNLIPIYLRVTVDGKRAEISTNRKISVDDWDSSACCAKGISEEVRILNNHLASLKASVEKQYYILESQGKEITAEALKNAVLGISEKKHSLIEIYQYHNDQIFQKIGKGFAPATWERHKVAIGKMKDFLRYKYHKTDIALDDLNFQFGSNYELYLKTHDNCGHNTTMKHIKSLKRIINFAIEHEWLDRNPFINIKCKFDDSKRSYLSKQDLTKLEEKVFSIPRLQEVKDIFLFSCYTGLAYSDVSALTPDDITIGIDGEKWIVIYRKKTGTRSPIPLLPQALNIIDRYKDTAEITGKLLPFKSNQKMNGYLKEIADICGITQVLSTHVARHTFATTVTLANGVPIETVSKMLGHTDIRTTQIYSKVVDSKISSDMMRLKECLNVTPPKKVVNFTS